MTDIEYDEFVKKLYNISKIVNNQFLSLEAGIPSTRFSHSMHQRTKTNGGLYRFNKVDIISIVRSVKIVAAKIESIVIMDGNISEREQPFAYGNDYVSKIKALKKIINPAYLFRKQMGWTEGKQKLYLSKKKEEKYYNNFTDAQLQEINNGIQEIAKYLAGVELIKPEDKEQ